MYRDRVKKVVLPVQIGKESCATHSGAYVLGIYETVMNKSWRLSMVHALSIMWLKQNEKTIKCMCLDFMQRCLLLGVEIVYPYLFYYS